MDIAVIGLLATAVAFRIMRMTTGRQAAAPLDKKKFLIHLGIMVALLGYCLIGPLLRFGMPSSADAELRMSNLMVKANALRLEGKPEEAARVSTEALGLAERSYGTNDVRITPILGLHATSLSALARYAEAEGLRQRALTLAIRAHGEDHAEVALQENNLGALYVDMGQLDKAESLYRKALPKVERFTGQIPPVLPVLLDNLATLCELTARGEEASRLRERAKGYRPGR